MSAELIKAIAELIAAIAWPAVVLLVILMHREPIAQLLKNLKSLTLPGGIKFEAQLREAVEKEARVLAETSPDSTRKVTPEQLAAAERIKALVSREDAAAARHQMIQLAREYEQTRAALPPGDERTRRMEAVATRMRLLGIACAPFLSDFAESPSPGERLAAVSILEVQPNREYLSWLADRLGTETPFVGYHAALALQAAVRVLGQPERALLREVIAKAKKNLGHDREHSDRAQVLEQADHELQS
jgi:hypothetical protein